MEEPPDQNGRRDQHKAQSLVAPCEPPLLFACVLLGFLLQIRLDAGFDHGLLSGSSVHDADLAHHASV